MTNQKNSWRVWAVLLAVLWLQACGAAHTGEARTEENVLKQMQDYWDRHSGYREETIRDGAFKTLRIGQAPVDVLVALGELSAGQVVPVQERRYATNATELAQLRDAGALRMGPGVGVFHFEKGRVTLAVVGHGIPYKDLLESATTRDEVFALLAKIVRPDPRGLYTVMTDDPTAKAVIVPGASPAAVAQISRFGTWQVAFEDAEGYWGASLSFDQGRLAVIRTQFSRLEPL